MPQPRKAGRFGGSPAHHKHIVGNLASELIRHGRITTTHTRAKTVQPTAERLITFAKRGDLHSRRQAGKVVRDPDVLHHLFAEVGPAFAERDGGYTRVLKLNPRKGDNAPMALIELVADVGHATDGTEVDEPRRRWSLRRRSAASEEKAEAPTAAAAASSEEEPSEPEPSEADPEATSEPAVADETEADPAEVEARLAAEQDEADEAKVAEAEEELEPPEDEDGDQDKA